MNKVSKTTTRVTRTVTVDLSDEQIDEILIKACGFDDRAKVDWDIGDGYIRSVTVTSSTVEES